MKDGLKVLTIRFQHTNTAITVCYNYFNDKSICASGGDDKLLLL